MCYPIAGAKTYQSFIPVAPSTLYLITGPHLSPTSGPSSSSIGYQRASTTPSFRAPTPNIASTYTHFPRPSLFCVRSRRHHHHHKATLTCTHIELVAVVSISPSLLIVGINTLSVNHTLLTPFPLHLLSFSRLSLFSAGAVDLVYFGTV